MRKAILFTGLLVMLVMMAGIVSADDERTPKPGTPADNECYPGGVLYREENQDGCPTLWYWKAGWFLARFNRGFISREDFPKEFESVLPPLPKPEDPIRTVCASNNAIADWYGCMSSNQTGTETVNNVFYSYLLFVNTSSECPGSFNGLGLDGATSTQTYMISYYQFKPAQVAYIGGVRPITCIYAVST